MEEIFEDQFNFKRNTYLTVGSILRNCIKLLPSTKPNVPQQLFIADTRGVLYVTEFKKTEPEIKVSTTPFQREITCVDLEYNINKEKIHFCFGSSIYITNRLCKDYSKIEFDIADNITFFRIVGSSVFAAYNSSIGKYEYGDLTVDKGAYDNDTNITCLCIADYPKRTNQSALIGTEDGKIKVIQGKDCLMQKIIGSAPTFIVNYKKSVHDMSDTNYVFGTRRGSHGIFSLDEKGIEVLWENNIDKNMSEIVTIKIFDINFDGSNELIIARMNGDVEIYAMGETIMDSALISKTETGQLITGADIGRFKSDEEIEIILSSYSGLVFSLSCPIDQGGQRKAIDKKTLTKNIKELNDEIIRLKQSLNQKNEEISKTVTLPSSIVKNPYKVDYKLTLLPKEALFVLSIESEFPIELIVLQSNINIDIIEIITKDVNINHVNNDKQKFNCTLKLKEGVNLLELKLRTYESMSDNILCTIIPYNTPKTAYVLEVPVVALSLHRKMEENEAIEIFDENVMNVLTIKGKFAATELNQMLLTTLPGITDKIVKENISYKFKSTFLNTAIEIEIDPNICKVSSLFLSPLITIKEQLTREANYRKKDIEFNIKIKTLSIFKLLESINPMIEENFDLESYYKILQAFKELDIKVILFCKNLENRDRIARRICKNNSKRRRNN